jgi:hypothetical protein
MVTPRQLRSKAIDATLSGLEAVYAWRLRKYPALRELLASFAAARSTGVSKADSIALYEHVVARRPNPILELGAGQSSAVIALAAREAGYVPRFVAVEEDAAWLDHHREVIPPPLLAGIELMRLDTAVTGLNGLRAAHYLDVPRLPYEFVHVDGPENSRLGCEVSCDIVELLPQLGKSCLVVFDGREDSARMAAPYLRGAGFALRRHFYTLSHEFVRP